MRPLSGAVYTAFSKAEGPSKSLLGAALRPTILGVTHRSRAFPGVRAQMNLPRGAADVRRALSLGRTQLPGRVPLDPSACLYAGCASSLCCSGCGIPAWGCEPTLQGEGASQPTPLRASEPAPAPGLPLSAAPLSWPALCFLFRAPETKYVQSAALVLVFKPAVHVSAVNPGAVGEGTRSLLLGLSPLRCLTKHL